MFEYQFEGYFGAPSKCGLEIVPGHHSTLVICTELNDNPGTSVTNIAEELATKVCQEYAIIDPTHMTWVEHYPVREDADESWDVVMFRQSGPRLHSPHWTFMSGWQVASMREALDLQRQPENGPSAVGSRPRGSGCGCPPRQTRNIPRATSH